MKQISTIEFNTSKQIIKKLKEIIQNLQEQEEQKLISTVLPKPIPPIPLSFCNSKEQSKINQTPTYINTENRKTGIKENRPMWGKSRGADWGLGWGWWW